MIDKKSIRNYQTNIISAYLRLFISLNIRNPPRTVLGGEYFCLFSCLFLNAKKLRFFRLYFTIFLIFIQISNLEKGNPPRTVLGIRDRDDNKP